MNINLVIHPTPNEQASSDYEEVILNQIHTIPTNVCSNMSINHVLNYLTNEQLVSLLGKMRHGGIISISSFDAMQMAKALYWGEIDIEKFSSLIVNNQTQHSLLEMKTFFEKNGYVVDTAYLNGLSFNIKAKRP